ncbi:hypothetical protein WR25_12798 [Diploscapter pachys]|uniref:Kinesin-like protein n=1 Tax=Diploscapter pachys TaxID=2018661 RepID=A0A2A2K8D6_9BILA|nr:hypothetical protein WR25_12798 [Diploscapter pachys]
MRNARSKESSERPTSRKNSMTNQGQLTVVVRVRPLNKDEKDRRQFQCVFPLDKQRILLVDPEKYENNILRQNRPHEKLFNFDATFGPNSTQEDVHAATTGPVIEALVAGYNATVFAYGATGSGKTYTMIGTKEKPGLMTLLTQSLYEKINPQEYTVLLSYLEIYNELIRDLLNPQSGVLDLMEDERGNIRVPGLSTVRAPNVNRIMQILQEGNLRRTQEATQANKTSSRSHALLQVTLLKNNRPYGKLFMIDLAGSERAANTQNRGQRLKEGAAINRSLLALGNVINSLSSSKPGYVNYRDSKLTRLLKDSLGGSAKTCMIAHVTPASGRYEETYNTLVYAARAKNITNNIVRNRPVSADGAYSEAMKELHRDLERRMPHAASTNQLSRLSPSTYSERASRYSKWNSSNASLKNGFKKNENISPNTREFGSLFNQLKEQFIQLTSKQQDLREKLMLANQEAYDFEMQLVSKKAIVSAWEKTQKGDMAVDSINRLKAECRDIETSLLQTVEQRQKIEKALRKGDETAAAIENRMRGISNTKGQNEMLDLIVKMAQLDAQRISALNDLAIHEMILQKTDTSMAKLQKYESLADKLIEGQLEDKDREQLEQEYRLVKNQFHYHLLPLKNIQNAVSWNSQLLPRIRGGSPKEEVRRRPSSRKRDSIQLPIIVNGREKFRLSSSSDSGEVLTSEDETLLVGRNSLLVLDLGLDVLDGVRGLDFQSDGLSSEGLDEDLHASTETQDEMEGRLLLDVVVGQILTSEDETLLIGWDSLLVLDLGLDVLNRIRGLDLQSDGLSSEGLDEDLHASTETEHEMQSGLLLDVVVGQVLTGEDKTLLIGWDSLLVLDLGLDVLDRVRSLDLQGDGLAGQGFNEDLHSTTETEHEMEGGLFLDIVVRQSAAILELLS